MKRLPDPVIIKHFFSQFPKFNFLNVKVYSSGTTYSKFSLLSQKTWSQESFFRKKIRKKLPKKNQKICFSKFQQSQIFFLWFKIKILAAVGLILVLHSYHYAVDPHCQNATSTYWAFERWRVC